MQKPTTITSQQQADRDAVHAVAMQFLQPELDKARHPANVGHDVAANTTQHKGRGI